MRRALEELRQHLPETMPLSGLSICAVGDAWSCATARRAGRSTTVSTCSRSTSTSSTASCASSNARSRPADAASTAEPQDWFDQGLELEAVRPAAARERTSARWTWIPRTWPRGSTSGRLLHEQRQDERRGERLPARARRLRPGRAADFNLGVLLEDLRRPAAALEAYQSAVVEDPSLADCHYNLARLYESFGKPQHAIRHLGQYRRLLTGG